MRFARASLRSLLVAAALVAGCFKPTTVDCGDNFICPPGLACAAPGHCGVRALVSACQGAGKVDFDPCDYRQDADRMCTDGECEPCKPGEAGCVAGSCLNGICGECNADRAGCPLPDWTQMSSPTSEILRSVWMASPSEAYIAGGGVQRYNGLAWSSLLPADVDDFASVSGAGSSRDADSLSLWVVRSTGELLHFDGSSWSSTQLPDGADLLNSVWANRRDDVWAVGFGTVLHFDGSTWELVSVPGLPATEDILAVAGAGDVVTAVGTKGHVIQRTAGQWSVTRLAAPYDSIELTSVWHASPGEAYAVGPAILTESQPSLLRYANGTWSAVSLDTPMVVDLVGVWGSSPADVIAVGDRGTVLSYDGVSWAAERAGGTLLRSVHGASDVRLIVGDSGVIFRRRL